MTDNAPKVLVVEDDAALREIMGDACTALGHPAVLAGTGAEALAALTEHPSIGLALIDIVLAEGATGFQIAQRMRSEGMTTRIIFLSGMGEHAERPQEFSNAEVRRKPLPLQVLRQTLDAALGQG